MDGTVASFGLEDPQMAGRMMSYDNWKTTDPAERHYKPCPKCGNEIYLPDCLEACDACGQDLRQYEPDPDRLYDEWLDRQFEEEQS
jgi:hypothetical protein